MISIMDYKSLALDAASRFGRFKQTYGGGFNFRCPYCGDSAKSSTKARAYLYCKKGFYGFKCHNCSKACSLVDFLKDQAVDLYESWLQQVSDSETPLQASSGSAGKVSGGATPKITQLPQGKPGEHLNLKRSSYLTPNHLYRNPKKNF